MTNEEKLKELRADYNWIESEIYEIITYCTLCCIPLDTYPACYESIACSDEIKAEIARLADLSRIT